MPRRPFLPTDEVRAACTSGGRLHEHPPLVALESTILAHGLPFPANLEVGRALEDAVRAAGAVPATIAVADGQMLVGLTPERLEDLCRRGDVYRKAGVADLAVVLASGGLAATTVSATATIAARFGIRVFATGGIGGVHRGDAADVSSDLTVLAREPICVVSAGAKAILDLPRTAEVLETLGVLVLGYRTDELPAFYTRTSGIRLEHRVETAAEVAAIWRVRHEQGLGGILLANPIPEEAALDRAEVEAAITAALAAAEARAVRGKALTPFLLAELARVTSGRSVAANRALALANARLAAEVAVALGGRPPG